MQICYLLNYNNYYNREYKKLNTIWDYEPYIKYTWTNVNFNPGDGITTTIPVNYDGEVNYFILSEGIGPGLAGEEIIITMRGGNHHLLSLRKEISNANMLLIKL